MSSTWLCDGCGKTWKDFDTYDEAKKHESECVVSMMSNDEDRVDNQNAGLDEGKVTLLKSIAELRDSSVLTEDEFQEQKSRILAEPTEAVSNQTHFKEEGEPLIQFTENSIGTGGAVLIIVGVLFACVIIGSLFSGGDTAEVLYSDCWSGAFNDGDSIISISGCGNKSFECGGGYCGINAQKQDDSAVELCVKVGSKEACTTAEYGVAQV